MTGDNRELSLNAEFAVNLAEKIAHLVELRNKKRTVAENELANEQLLTQFYQLLLVSALQKRQPDNLEEKITACISENVDPILVLLEDHLTSNEIAEIQIFSSRNLSLLKPPHEMTHALELNVGSSRTLTLMTELLAQLDEIYALAFYSLQKQ